MPEAFFRIEIGGAGQGPSWCLDRNLPYKNCWHGIDSWARKWRCQHNLNLPECFGSYSMPYLCKLQLHITVYQLKNRGQDGKNCDVANWWPSPKYIRLKSLSIKKLALSPCHPSCSSSADSYLRSNFNHLLPSALLCTLNHAPGITENRLRISADDWELFRQQ